LLSVPAFSVLGWYALFISQSCFDSMS